MPAIRVVLFRHLHPLPAPYRANAGIDGLQVRLKCQIRSTSPAILRGDRPMIASRPLCLQLFGAFVFLAAAWAAALAQTPEETKPGAPPAAKGEAAPKPAGDAAKTTKNPPKDQEGKTAKPAKPSAPSGWASETEARAHCKGTVVWVDKDHFNHYRGSREFGRKPGNFACEG
jgi:hypothetical protein